jgi:hypothetical protein
MQYMQVGDLKKPIVLDFELDVSAATSIDIIIEVVGGTAKELSASPLSGSANKAVAYTDATTSEVDKAGVWWAHGHAIWADGRDWHSKPVVAFTAVANL